MKRRRRKGSAQERWAQGSLHSACGCASMCLLALSLSSPSCPGPLSEDPKFKKDLKQEVGIYIPPAACTTKSAFA
eukprot:245936-Amphidinium_carterae.2